MTLQVCSRGARDCDPALDHHRRHAAWPVWVSLIGPGQAWSQSAMMCTSRSFASGCHQSFPPLTDSLAFSAFGQEQFRFEFVKPGRLIVNHLQ